MKTETGRGAQCLKMMAMLAAVAAAAVAHGDGSYTWAGGTSGNWDSSTANWDDGTANVAWVEGTNAVFNNSSATTINVSGSHVASNITITGSSIVMNGSGPLSWTGVFKTSKTTTIYCPFTDNGDGLHFDICNHTYLRNSSSHTGGTYIKNTSGNSVAFIFSDAVLGPVPATPTNNIIIQAGSGKAALHFDQNSGGDSIHRNRKVLIEDGATMWVGSNSELHFYGDINGAKASNGYPTGTRVGTYTEHWKARAYLHGTNYFGRLYVEGNMEIADGRTTVVTTDQGTKASAALYVKGPDNATSYSTQRGYLRVSGGTLCNYQGGYRFEVSYYGHLDIDGGTVSLASAEFLNALTNPGKTTIRNGGLLDCSVFRLSQTSVGNGGELHLVTNGTLKCNYIWMDFANAGKGIVHFNGGKLQAKNGNNSQEIVLQPTNAKWDACTFQVEEGGAIFDTSNGQHIYFGRPLVSGVGDGKKDGGVICRLANGRAVVMDNADTHSYTGPTRLEAVNSGTDARTLQCRGANILPATTTLQLGPGTQVGFSDWVGASDEGRTDQTQKVARVEGCGRVFYNSLLTVTNAVAPVFDGTYGTLSFQKPCSLSGDYELTGDRNGCGCLKFESSGQNISGLAMKVSDFTALNENAQVDFYKILDAPNGYTGKFADGNLSGAWHVQYTTTAAYLFCQRGTVIVFR